MGLDAILTEMYIYPFVWDYSPALPRVGDYRPITLVLLITRLYSVSVNPISRRSMQNIAKDSTLTPEPYPSELIFFF